MIRLLVVPVLLGLLVLAWAQTGLRIKNGQALPPRYWPLEKSQPIIDKTQTIRLALFQ